jgi:LPS-assembly protein
MVVAVLMLGAAGGVRPAAAQYDNRQQPWVGIPSQTRVPTASSKLGGPRDPNAQMLVRADEMQYDNSNNRLIAVGNVQIYYDGSLLEAYRVFYFQN